jgi:hypothetical protein
MWNKDYSLSAQVINQVQYFTHVCYFRKIMLIWHMMFVHCTAILIIIEGQFQVFLNGFPVVKRYQRPLDAN